MSLWKFIENKLAEMGKDERWLEDECGFTGYMLPRIRSGGTIQNATKQKLAKAFKCSIGDVNAAIAERDLPEPKAELLTGETTMKEVASKMKVPADNIKWYSDQDAINTPQSGPVAVITEPKVTVLDVEAYKQKLKDVCILQLCEAAKGNVKDAEIIYKAIGRTLLSEIMK